MVHLMSLQYWMLSCWNGRTACVQTGRSQSSPAEVWNTESVLQTFDHDTMVDRIERSTEIEQTKQRYDFCLVHTADTDMTRLSCLIIGVNRVGDCIRQYSVVLNIQETEQFCPVPSAVWTRLQTLLILFTPHFETGQNCLKLNMFSFDFFVARSIALSLVLFIPPTWTIQDSLIFSCPCQQYELYIT